MAGDVQYTLRKGRIRFGVDVDVDTGVVDVDGDGAL